MKRTICKTVNYMSQAVWEMKQYIIIVLNDNKAALKKLSKYRKSTY
ncbi:MAG: hypothetical protein WC756_05140 [Taibaiella sp.]